MTESLACRFDYGIIELNFNTIAKSAFVLSLVCFFDLARTALYKNHKHDISEERLP